jgi:hypothetical protein
MHQSSTFGRQIDQKKHSLVPASEAQIHVHHDQQQAPKAA